VPISSSFFPKERNLKDCTQAFIDGIMHPNSSHYCSQIVTVLRKEGTWCMYHDFKVIETLIVKDKFPIPVIVDLLDELYGAHLFTNLIFAMVITKFV
jgi:hypothetical protein